MCTHQGVQRSLSSPRSTRSASVRQTLQCGFGVSVPILPRLRRWTGTRGVPLNRRSRDVKVHRDWMEGLMDEAVTGHGSIGTVALVGAGEFLPAMDPVDRGLLASIAGPARVVVLPTASAPDGPGV